jgi:membrane-associated phospholipid phosphatase
MTFFKSSSALAFCLRVIFSENRFPLFGIMLYGRRALRTGRGMSTSNNAAPRTLGPGIVFAALSALVQNIPANLLRWILVLVRSPRVPPPRWGTRAIAAFLLVIAVIVASMFFFDTVAIDWARREPLWLNAIADQVTDLGRSSTFLYPFGFVLLIVAAAMTPSLPPMARGVLAMLAVRFGFLFVAIGLPSLFATIIKRLIGRARPYVGGYDDPLMYIPFIWKPEYASMPSGHATTAAAAAIAIGAVWPRLRGVMWLYVLIIMLSRILIFVHHPSDVLGGALVGVVGALLVRRWFAARRLGFSPRDLQAYPWPSWPRLKTVARQIVGGPTISTN